MEAVQAAPETFLQTLHDRLRLPAPGTVYRPVVKRLGAKFLPSVETRPETPKALVQDDLAFLRDTLDLRTEAALGYTYDTLGQS